MKYVAMTRRPRASGNWVDQPPIAAATTVYEADDDSPQETGLLDVTGTPLYRMPDKKRIGYI